jgi:hypothetical protein|nr:MAG TPA: hypothetical protein [Bacteriophage sp.]DAW74821.1 MAG TPA: hypothetical protein [Ackermannviridae sp.]
MELTEEKRNLNFVLWTKKLKDYNCYSESLINELGEKLKNASFNMNEANGGCYEGSLIEVILNNLCTLGYHINELAFGLNDKGKRNHPFLNVNTEMIMRVLLLQHISKAEYFITQTENWKKNKGYLFDFNGELETQLKMGERSAFLCMKHGIQLSEIEFEAMTIVDKDDKCFNSHQNQLVVLVKTINQLVAVELQRKYDYNKKVLQGE